MFTYQLHSVIPTVYYKLSFGLCSWHTCSLCWRRGCHCGCMGWVLNQTASFPSSVQCCQLEACANFFFSAKHARFVFNPFTCKTVNKSLFKKRYGKKLNLYQNGQKCQTCVCVCVCVCGWVFWLQNMPVGNTGLHSSFLLTQNDRTFSPPLRWADYKGQGRRELIREMRVRQ